jgi:hypothetical protein
VPIQTGASTYKWLLINTSVLPIHAAFHRPKPLLWKLFGFFR